MKSKYIKLLDKYILKEIAFPFIFSVIIITIILIGNYLFQLTDLIIVKKVPINLVLELLIYNLPDIIVKTFPIAILFSTMTGIGRLNSENEITAFRMGGISLYRLIIPVLILGILVSGLTYIFNEEVVPWANHRAQNIIRNTVLKESMPDLREEVFFKGPKGRLFYVKEYDEKNGILNNIIVYNIKENNSTEEFPEVITAKQGTISENTWLLKNGIIHQYNKEGNIILESRFNEMEFEISEEMREIYGTQKTTSEMNREELSKNIQLFKKSGINIDSLLVDYHLKLAQPLVSFIFVLIAVPLSLTNKESKALNIAFTIIIIFAYYLLVSVSRSLGRNQILQPLVAAWLPNIIFLILGMLILFLQESWRNFLHKILPILMILFIIFNFFLINPAEAADDFTVNSDSLYYNEKTNILTLRGNINGKYDNIYIKSDIISIKMSDNKEKLFNSAENIELLPGIISGCDFSMPHYYFDAKKIIISPNNYLKAYNVVFRELDGKLPLFYWPYLYISLKDEKQSFFPRIGYNSNRGWFLKTTYNYYLEGLKLPGSLYIDYYTLTGFAGGIKQYILDRPNHKAYLYYYTQDNNIDIPNLFNWEGEFYHTYEGKDWNEEFLYFYQEFDDKEKTQIDLSFDYRKNNKNIYIDTYYDILDYNNDSIKDIKEYGANLTYNDILFNNLLLNTNYRVDYDYDPEDGLDEYEDRSINVINRWDNNWEAGISYEHESQNEPETNPKSRWSGKGYITKDYKDINYEILWERYDPKFTEEDEVAFYKSPEFTISYRPEGNIDYKLQYGQYYEDISKIKGDRINAEIIYNNRLEIIKNNVLNINQKLNGSIYNISDDNKGYDSYQVVSKSNVDLSTRLGNNITLNNSYEYIDYLGYSPFNFDLEEFTSLMENKFTYNKENRLSFEINTGYDFNEKEYLLLNMFSNFKLTKNWTIKTGLKYDLNNQYFEDNIYLISRYNNEKLNHNLGFEYDKNNNSLVRLDSNFSYKISGDWGWYLENNISLNFEEDEIIREANLELEKNFHCRKLIFSYDYLDNEYTIQYQINLFPSMGIEFIKNDEKLIFDSDIEDFFE